MLESLSSTNPMENTLVVTPTFDSVDSSNYRSRSCLYFCFHTSPPPLEHNPGKYIGKAEPNHCGGTYGKTGGEVLLLI